MDRKAFQGESVDTAWLDEDPGDDCVYGECLARLTATRGQIVFSATPTLGTTPVRKRFKEHLSGTAEVLMTIDDCVVSRGGHIPDEDVPVIVARYKANERATRAYGADATGEGAVFEIPEDAIKHSRDPATFPWYWPWLWAVDFSHGGMSAQAHPFAAVLGCWDRDADCIYVVHAIRMRQALPVSHVAAIKGHVCWDAPVAWPHDGGHTGFESTETFAATYKRLGLNMRGTHATFPRGGYNFESGITEIEQRLATGRLKIASHLGRNFRRISRLSPRRRSGSQGRRRLAVGDSRPSDGHQIREGAGTRACRRRLPAPRYEHGRQERGFRSVHRRRLLGGGIRTSGLSPALQSIRPIDHATLLFSDAICIAFQPAQTADFSHELPC